MTREYHDVIRIQYNRLGDIAIVSEYSKIVRAGFDNACRSFGERIAPFGFQGTKRRFWVRLNSDSADTIYFHRSGETYGAPICAEVDIRVECSLYILDAPLDTAYIHGPVSDAVVSRKNRYHLRFNAKSGSMFERCIDDLVRFFEDHCEPWFMRCANLNALARWPNRILSRQERLALQKLLRAGPSPEQRTHTLKRLGLKK
ncbi:hypothetical protein HED60_03635 [Planctomycetales bacterium ZRK34]|nr:hypothetical protein HED60_03635 [Planctomycetales bacterium ZRK34]